MPKAPPHIKWLIDTKQRVKTDEGATIEIWELAHNSDKDVLSAWAKHFREQYCGDDILDALVEGTGLSRSEYLKQHKFPNAKIAPGPSIRAGDFAEILVADFIEFIQGYWCPRERFSLKTVPNESPKGSDVIGFRILASKKSSPSDEMFVLESKADLTGSNSNRLQDAVDDSAKDPVRHAASLNALKQRFIEKDILDSAKAIARFQDPTDRPYKFKSGAVLVCSDPNFVPATLKKTTLNNHPNSGSLALIVVKGPMLMELVHALYERAANES